MDTLSRIRFLSATCYTFQFPKTPAFSTTTPFLSSLKASRTATTTTSTTVSDADEDVLQIFLKERELNGDFVSRTCDLLWQMNARNSGDYDVSKFTDNNSQQIEQSIETNSEGGFLKLSSTQEWLLGENSAPINRKMTAKIIQDNRARLRKLNKLKYQSLKRELLFLSVGIGLACSGYCLLVFSVQAALSYGIGVLFSCLYLQLLYQHADNISSETVPQIFTKKKSKTGSGISLSSPRLVIPAAIYGLWVLSHQYFSNDWFDFQLVPAMFGMFVYKAAALVQVYRDNKDLGFEFPEDF
ncbi:unnamed protein product [Trifolium pratense]|uniref:Uncharacterized protein n=1 Tax=Trifolium pratense TaxID=57577 RepID=A0ACB0KBQ5_TRIPR|nr:unnamed protein product [Trifolium pratense]